MLKVKKSTYSALPKNNELSKLTSDMEEEKNRKNKTINDQAKLIQSIKKEYQSQRQKMKYLKKNDKNRR